MMDTIAGASDASLVAKVKGAQHALATAVSKANLTGDPLGAALEALSVSLGAQLALHRASTGHLRDVSEQLDLQVSQSLAYAGTALAAQEAAIVSTLVPQLAMATDQSVRARLWTIKFRTLAVSTAGAVVLALAAMTGGYTMGFASGHASGLYTANTITAAAERDGPAAANTWAQIIGNNDVRSAMAECMKVIANQGGRRACSLPIWLDPAPAPAVVTGKEAQS